MEEVLKILEDRGVELKDFIEIVKFAQLKYQPNLKDKDIKKVILKILKKNEVIFAIKTGVALDIMAEEGKLPFGLNEVLMNDEPLYGIDEILTFSITNLFGSIAFTNFGYLDKVKVGILEKLNEKDGKVCNTFLDDIVASIAASACSRLAHKKEI